MPAVPMPTATREVSTAGPYWFVDNGAVLCSRHLGTPAAMTGRDLSGQKIVRLTGADVVDIWGALGVDTGPVCETCRAIAAST